MRGYGALLSGAALIGAGFWVWSTAWDAGYGARSLEVAVEVDRARDAAVRAAEIASRKEAERLASEAEAARLAREMEDLANADAVLVPECLSADRVRRLEAR